MHFYQPYPYLSVVVTGNKLLDELIVI